MRAKGFEDLPLSVLGQQRSSQQSRDAAATSAAAKLTSQPQLSSASEAVAFDNQGTPRASDKQLSSGDSRIPVHVHINLVAPGQAHSSNASQAVGTAAAEAAHARTDYSAQEQLGHHSTYQVQQQPQEQQQPYQTPFSQHQALPRLCSDGRILSGQQQFVLPAAAHPVQQQYQQQQQQARANQQLYFQHQQHQEQVQAAHVGFSPQASFAPPHPASLVAGAAGSGGQPHLAAAAGITGGAAAAAAVSTPVGQQQGWVQLSPASCYSVPSPQNLAALAALSAGMGSTPGVLSNTLSSAGSISMQSTGSCSGLGLQHVLKKYRRAKALLQAHLHETQRLKAVAASEAQRAAAAEGQARELELQLAASTAAIAEATMVQQQLQQQVSMVVVGWWPSLRGAGEAGKGMQYPHRVVLAVQQQQLLR